MDVKRIFYRIRLSLLMYGFASLLQAAAVISRNFRSLLAKNDYSFNMGSKEDDTARHFQFIGGIPCSGRGRMPADFSLIWRDNQSGGSVMMAMISGKRNALHNAVMNGLLTLEGEAKHVASLIESMKQLNLLFGLKKKASKPGKTVA